MKLTEEQITSVKQQFEAVKTKQELLDLLNKANKLIKGESTEKISIKTLNYYANPEYSINRYKSFEIKKKSGGVRVINSPVYGYKTILRALNLIINCVYTPYDQITGFVHGKSIADNARMHVGRNYVYNIDLKDFFHSFDRNKVKMGFMFEPFNLSEEKEKIAFLLSSLCTHPFEINGEIKVVLPQGSPTSPIITNVLCMPLDRRLKGLAKRFGLTYSRYADDITFSSNHNIYRDREFLDELSRIIQSQGLEINPKKIRLQKMGYRQEVTGLVVNKKVNVTSKYLKEIRMWIYFWEKYGYTKATELFLKDYVGDKGHVKNANAKLENVLNGKLHYLRMIKGRENNTYKRLKARYDVLSEKQSHEVKSEGDLKKIVQEILNSGLDSGLKLFDSINK